MNLQTKLAEFEQVKSICQTASPARERLAALFDEGTFVEMDGFVPDSGVITGYGFIEGSVAYAFSQDTTSMGGAVSKAHAQKLCKLYDLAVKNGGPIVAIYDSNGGKLSDGMEVLAAFQQILAYANNLSGVVPQIAVVAGSCVGISAMMAASADILVMAKDATLYLTDANGETSADAAMACGAADLIADDAMQAVAKAKEIVAMLPLNNLSMAPVGEGTAPAAAVDPDASLSELAASICDLGSVVELKADYDANSLTALAMIGGATVGLVGVKGKMTLKSNQKVSRFVRFCDCFNLPVVSLVDVAGFCGGGHSQKAFGAQEAAKLAHAYAEATTAKIAVYTGSVIGAAGVAFGAADVKIAWPVAVISALPVATAVEFFHHDALKGAEDVAAKRAELEAIYASEEASPFAAAKAGLVDQIIDPAQTRGMLIAALEMLASKRETRLPKKHSN
jgi:acetyl-CoA carboxylase carboxyltransferase component